MKRYWVRIRRKDTRRIIDESISVDTEGQACALQAELMKRYPRPVFTSEIYDSLEDDFR